MIGQAIVLRGDAASLPALEREPATEQLTLFDGRRGS
jgi:hypothetical protein